MAATAMHIVDRVLPAVPLRQWVLSVPYELRPLLAADPAVLTLTSRVFFEELRRWYRGASGIDADGDLRIETGAITFVHRGGGSLNLHTHLHVIAADGVWRCETDGSTPGFIPTRPPTRADMEGVLVRVARRVAAGIERTDDGSAKVNEALAACQRAASTRGTFGAVRDEGTTKASAEVDTDEARFDRRPSKNQVGILGGFNLHASVVIGAGDVEGRERLLRYVARPMVVGERVTELEDGRVAWRLKRPGSRGETHRIMEPMEFMARLAGLVPPPRIPQTRYHGALAPNSPWRAAVIPPTPIVVKGCEGAGRQVLDAESSVDGSTTLQDDPWQREPSAGTQPTAQTRLSGRIDWATLMHRVWGWDVLACPCGGRMQFIAVITQRPVIERILKHVGLPSDRIEPLRARSWDDTS